MSFVGPWQICHRYEVGAGHAAVVDIAVFQTSTVNVFFSVSPVLFLFLVLLVSLDESFSAA